jgi:hypothetical protein
VNLPGRDQKAAHLSVCQGEHIRLLSITERKTEALFEGMGSGPCGLNVRRSHSIGQLKGQNLVALAIRVAERATATFLEEHVCEVGLRERITSPLKKMRRK